MLGGLRPKLFKKLSLSIANDDMNTHLGAMLLTLLLQNVADRRRHNRLPTSPIGDLEPLP